jgi:sulfate permease
MFLTYVAIGVALFFAMNIGASGAAATMGAAYGSGAIKRKKIALYLVAVGVFMGAILGSSEVVNTIGEGIIPSSLLTVEIAVIILASATATLLIANLIGIPLSTSEVTVGAIVGVGIAFQTLFIQNVLIIVLFWILVPLAAFILSYFIGKLILVMENRWPQLREGRRWRNWLGALMVLTGFIEAFAAGMNNVANAVGPIVGAGILEGSTGIWLGGLFVAIGAICLGSRVLETNGKKITRLSLLQGSAVSTTGGALVIIASIFGIPVPITQVTTSAILGIGTAENGFRLWQKSVIGQIIKVWLVSPVSSLVLSYSLINAVLIPNPYTMIVIISVFVATLGSISLAKAIRKEKSSVHDHGGGI